MPAVVRFECAFGKYGGRGELIVDCELRTADVVPVGHRHVFSPVEIDEHEAALAVDFAKTGCNLLLDGSVLVDSDETGPVVHVGLPQVLTCLVRRRLAAPQPALAAGEFPAAVGQLLILCVAHEFVANAQNPAALFGAQHLGRAFDTDFGIGRPELAGKNSFRHIIQAAVGRLAAHIRIVDRHLAIVDMQSRDQPCCIDALANLAERCHVPAVPPEEMSAGPREIGIIDDHRAESTLESPTDVLVDIVKRHVPQFVVGPSVLRTASALNSAGHAIVFFDQVDIIEKFVGLTSNQHCTLARHSYLMLIPGIHLQLLTFPESVDASLLVGAHQADCRLGIPGDIEPLAEMLAAVHRQLH